MLQLYVAGSASQFEESDKAGWLDTPLLGGGLQQPADAVADEESFLHDVINNTPGSKAARLRNVLQLHWPQQSAGDDEDAVRRATLTVFAACLKLSGGVAKARTYLETASSIPSDEELSRLEDMLPMAKRRLRGNGAKDVPTEVSAAWNCAADLRLLIISQSSAQQPRGSGADAARVLGAGAGAAGNETAACVQRRAEFLLSLRPRPSTIASDVSKRRWHSALHKVAALSASESSDADKSPRLADVVGDAQASAALEELQSLRKAFLLTPRTCCHRPHPL